MRINEHNLESLRRVVRDLQQENQALKAILEENSIPFESRNVLEDQFLPDEYDEDQGARILPYYPNEDMAREFYSYFWGRMDVFAKRGRKGDVQQGGTIRFVRKRGMRRLFAMRIVSISHGSRWSYG